MATKILAACTAVLFLVQGVHLHPLEPGIVALKWLGIVLFIVVAAALNRSLRR